MSAYLSVVLLRLLTAFVSFSSVFQLFFSPNMLPSIRGSYLAFKICLCRPSSAGGCCLLYLFLPCFACFALLLLCFAAFLYCGYRPSAGGPPRLWIIRQTARAIYPGLHLLLITCLGGTKPQKQFVIFRFSFNLCVCLLPRLASFCFALLCITAPCISPAFWLLPVAIDPHPPDHRGYISWHLFAAIHCYT